jgi:signal transduction histidine kinase/CheY-like chemotaxis protein
MRFLSNLATAQYQSIADRALDTALEISNRKRLGTITMAGIAGSVASNASKWPFITIPGYESMATNLIDTSSGREMVVCPLVQQEQLEAFEDFAYDYYYNKRQPPFDNETAAVKPFGRGVWGMDASGDFYHVTNGTTLYQSPHQDIVTPVLHHNAGPFPALMLNLRFEENRGKAIDGVIACSNERKLRMMNDTFVDKNIQCGTISDMIILTSQEVEPGPGALIFSPIYPDQDPTELVGVLASSIVWDEVLQNLFSNAVKGIDCVLSTDTQTYTYHIEKGMVSPARQGDHHLKEYDEYATSILLSHASGLYSLDHSANYTLTLTPTCAFFETYQTSIPLIAATGAAVCILLTSICFVSYDAFVRRDMNVKTELLEAKRKFVRFVSHEVRTPLNSVCMGLTLLQAELAASVDEMNSETRGTSKKNKGSDSKCAVNNSVAQGWLKLSEEVLVSAKLSVGVLNDLLNYDKIQMGQLSLEYTVIPIYPLISMTIKEFSLPAASKKINFDLSYGGFQEFDDLNVVGDTIRLTQVLRNLLSNALKFTEEGGNLCVHVSSQEMPSKTCTFVMANGKEATYTSTDLLLVNVTDDGVGMSSDQLSKLFTAGTQFNVNQLQAGQGSGLGLFIARGIMEQHGGDLVATSKGLGKGTTFTMSLPLYKIESSVDEASAPAWRPSDIESDTHSTAEFQMDDSSSSNTPRQRRILVVDDAKMNRKLLRRLLENHGHTCDEAENGQEAVDMVRLAMNSNTFYDTILLDFEMPILNGPDACQIIRADLQCTSSTIVGITGNVMPEDVALFKGKGANGVLAKPFQMQELESLWAGAD